MAYEYRNLSYNQFGTINCEVNHPTWGWIPYTASPTDPEEYGRELYEEIIASGEPIAPYVPPPPEPENPIIVALADIQARLTKLERRKK